MKIWDYKSEIEIIKGFKYTKSNIFKRKSEIPINDIHTQLKFKKAIISL